MKKIYIKDVALNNEYDLLCWVADKQVHKRVVFLTVYDSTGKLECVAFKSDFKNQLFLKDVTKESAVSISGKYVCNTQQNKNEFVINNAKIIALATKKLSFYPNENKFDPLAKKHEKKVLSHPTFYVRNQKLAAIYHLKEVFKNSLHSYFIKNNFFHIEAPTLTRQTLYKDSGAIWLDLYDQQISLSRCATFHLEPALMAYEKLYTITNSHANERSKSNRHLIEYNHLKAEVCWTDLDSLIELAKDVYYEAAKQIQVTAPDFLYKVVAKERFEFLLEKLNPKNHVTITYDEAAEILKNYKFEFEYGKSLSTKSEQVLTKHFGENFVWVKYIPYTVEGFMFKRKPDNNFLTMTCDLIAPFGYGEILGCAEKMSSYDELLDSFVQSGKGNDIKRYQDYLDLRKLGLPQHGGIGMGIERAVRYLHDLESVKHLKPFAVVKSNNINH